MKSQRLTELDASFLEFTAQKGVLRCLRPEDDQMRAQGVNFRCPGCRKRGITALFDLPSVPKEAKPQGRFKAACGPLRLLSLDSLTLDKRVICTCEWFGVVMGGTVRWR